MKRCFFLILAVLCIYIIYCTHDNKKNYVYISDSINSNISNYIYNILNKKNKINDFNDNYISPSILKVYQDIKNNRTIKNNQEIYYLKKILRESDVVIINVGMEEMIKNYNRYSMISNYLFFDELYLKIEKMIVEVKKYAYGKIMMVGFYNPIKYYDSQSDQFFYYVYDKLNKLSSKYNYDYLDLYEIVKGNNYQDIRNSNLNNIGQADIAKTLVSYFE